MKSTKRKAKRIYKDDPEGEMLLPARKTKDIADKHLAEAKEKPLKGRQPMQDLEEKEDGKELFDFVLKKMAKPDNQ